MARLLARKPAEAALPAALTIGACTLEEGVAEAITWVSPFRGREAEVERALGLTFPGPGEVTEGGGRRALWFARGQALVLGPSVAPQGAAVADQSAAWTILWLEGPAVRDVLARLTPLDLRDRVFPVGTTARSLLGHMTASLTRRGDDTWEILVFRSMAGTAVHDLTRAMRHVAAR